MATIEEMTNSTIGDPMPLVWTSERFISAAEAGVFDEKRVELVESEVFEISPAGSRHTTTIGKVSEGLRIALVVDS